MTASYIEMIKYRRPEGSRYQKKFCRRFLEPVFGKPDAHGNYTLIVGDNPNIAFMAHHDTVHHSDSLQTVVIDGDFVVTTGKDCLGADCTTGVYIILKMIEAQVPGVYVVHAAEEIGCKGSAALVAQHPAWIDTVKAAISFDRKGYDSIITHQLGGRCCSEAFSDSFAAILGGEFKSDPTGSYTDSNEYVGAIGECTNLSVGYFNQHTPNEAQDMAFMEELIEHLISADWSKLVFERKPGEEEQEPFYNGKNYCRQFSTVDCYDDLDYSFKTELSSNEKLDMMSVIKRYPEQVAEILNSFGYNAGGLIDDCVDLKDRSKYRGA